MKYFSDCTFHFDAEKEAWIQRERGLSFGIIAGCMRSGKVIDVLDNPSAHYPHKKIALMEIEGYIVAVPYVRKGDDVLLKTAFKDRKANKKHKGKQHYGSQEKNSRLH